MAIVCGVLSLATMDTKVINDFKTNFSNVEERVNKLWKLSMNYPHIFMMDIDNTDYDSFKKDVFDFRKILFRKSIKIPDLFILRTSFDGYHIISPEIRPFKEINSLMSYFPQDKTDLKNYPTLTTRDYDTFATLRISHKFSKYGKILKEKPYMIEIILGNTDKPIVSKGHIELYNLPIFNNYILKRTKPILVKYQTNHRC